MSLLFRLRELRHMDAEDAVLVICRRLRVIDVIDVERTAHIALAALAADVVAFLVLLIVARLLFRCNGEVVVFIGQGDVLLAHARKLRGQIVAVAVVLDIDLEFRRMESLHERLIENVHHAIEDVVFSAQIVAANKWNQTKHNQNPLSSNDAPWSIVCASGHIVLFISIGNFPENPSRFRYPVRLLLSFPSDNSYYTRKSQKVNRSKRKKYILYVNQTYIIS